MSLLGDASKSRQAIVVQAANEKEARRKAAEKLGAKPSNVQVEAKGKGRFSARLLHARGDVRISISADRMEAKVTDVVQPLGDGGWPGPNALTESLRAQGVHEPSREALFDLSEKLENGQNVKGFVVAKGRMAVEPADASIEYDGDPKYPVLRGDNVGKKVPLRRGKDGVKVDGEPIRPKNQAKPKDIELPDKFFAVETSTGEFSAKGYGLLNLEGEELAIRPLLKIKDNNLTIVGTVYHKGFTGEPMTFAKYRHLLTQMGVAVEPDKDAIEAAIAKAGETGKPVKKVILARGQAPIEGRDGHFEMTLESAKNPDPGGKSVDHRERSPFLSVKPGEAIGTLHPPVRGQDGFDVFGNKIKPPEVKSIVVEPGEGVEVSEDGRQFRANAPGMVSWQGQMLCVVDALEIHGDVDYETGNVRLEKGSVRIRGCVRDGFVLTAPGDVAVGESIEGAKVVSQGGSVNVSGGIVTGDSGKVSAAMDVRASFAENAVIVAGGDVVIAQNMTNCMIKAAGKVVCTSGKGLIQGGRIIAVKGVECNEIGSEYGIKNDFFIGPQEEECRIQVDLLQKKKALKETVDRIDGALGGGTPKEILERTPPDKRIKVAEVIKARMAAAKKLQDVEEQIRQDFLERIESCAAARLKFRVKAWPGTRVTILGRTFTIDESMDASTVSFNPRTMEFEVT